jgi:signal transduction histidine kinase
VVRDNGLTLVDHEDSGAIIQGNRQLLAQLVTNLIENCLKYVPAGGRIDLTVKRLADSVCLVVSDNGPGLTPDDRVRAVQPFVRFGKSSRADSSGLGLSLVAAIARLHRARLLLENNEPGLRVVVELPLK